MCTNAHLHCNGTRIIKFYLHLSKEEQRKRFLECIDEPGKNWKFSLSDVEERSNPQPRAALYSEHGEDCEHRTLTGASTTRRSPLAGTSRPIRLGWFAAWG